MVHSNHIMDPYSDKYCIIKIATQKQTIGNDTISKVHSIHIITDCLVGRLVPMSDFCPQSKIVFCQHAQPTQLHHAHTYS